MKDIENNKKPYYITTPIYYPSGKWHIGHCYTTVCCDAIARYKRMSGYDVFYLTGTDEHGQKIAKRAHEAGKTPLAFVDELVDEIKQLWKVLDISYTKYIRTTDDYHVKAVQKIFKMLYDKGDIYKSSYKGKYCVPCEAFFTEKQLKDGKCPDCGRDTIDEEEECYFFRLSKYGDRIKELLTTTDFLEPKARVNEMVNFIDTGLDDLAVSRTSFKWGVPVSFDDKHVVYVWVDALSNYISGLGYLSGDDSLYKKFWPADVHVMAKEIVRFHSIIWPAILMSLELPLPKKVFGHGWIMFDGDKMSKSKGNVVDPFILSSRYGVDALRYYLIRDTQFGTDGNYTSELFLNRINSDLANDLGNLSKRTLAMAKQYFDGVVEKGEPTEFDAAFEARIDALKKGVDERIDKLQLNKAVEFIFETIGSANKYIDETRPWVLNKENEKEKLKTVIYNLLEALRVCATLLTPFIQNAPSKILTALGLVQATDFSQSYYGAVKAYKTTEIETLFPRYDIKKEIEQLEVIANEQKGQKEATKPVVPKAERSEASGSDSLISIDEFFKTSLKVAEVKQAERVAKSEKLIKILLDVNGEERIVVSGIAKSYTPEELIGRQVILVANLKPAKLCGILSHGMLLCADGKDGNPVLITPSVKVESGSEVR